MSAFHALLEAGYDVNYTSSNDFTFLEKLFITGAISAKKIEGVVGTRPVFHLNDYDRLEAKVGRTYMSLQ